MINCLDSQRLTRVPRVREVLSSNPELAYLIQHCKRFATAATSTQVAVLPWHYGAEKGTANLLHASVYYGKYKERLGDYDKTLTLQVMPYRCRSLL